MTGLTNITNTGKGENNMKTILCPMITEIVYDTDIQIEWNEVWEYYHKTGFDRFAILDAFDLSFQSYLEIH